MTVKERAASNIGVKYGRWTVISSPFMRSKGRVYVLCRCECGTERGVYYSSLEQKGGSCGCLRSEVLRTIKTKHGGRQRNEYQCWAHMKRRCDNPRSKGYENYGGRGIVYCEEWKDFKRFFEDMGPKPSPSHTLDRINNDGMYCKSNCRWATRHEQNSNRRNNRYLTFQEQTLTLDDWAGKTGIAQDTLWHRLKTLSVEEALTRPLKDVGRKRKVKVKD